MSKPTLVIGGTDFTDYVKSMTPTNNDLDAEGSGRDIITGEMFRTKIVDKDTLEVEMMRLRASTMAALRQKLDGEFVTVTYLNPKTNTQETKSMYCSSVNHGLQVYNKSKQDTFYSGASFQLTEK